jgi:hypothetical protein
MRPDTPYDPALKSVEEVSDVSAFEIFAPSPQEWIQLGTMAVLQSGQSKPNEQDFPGGPEVLR